MGEASSKISLNELRYFIWRVNSRSFTNAATLAGVSQSTLSAAIDSLETKLGAKVIDRDTNELTVAGQALLPRAKEALAAVDAAHDEVRRATIGAEEIRLGAVATAATYLLPPILKAFCDDNPRVRLRLREGHTDDLEAAIEQRELDLAVVTRPERTPRTRFDEWRKDQLIVASHPAMNPDTANWITFIDGSTRQTLLREYPKASIVMELGSIGGVKGNLRAGIGLALISRAAVEAELESQTLVVRPFPFTPITRQLLLLYESIDRLSRSGHELRNRLLADARAQRQASGAARRRAG